MEEDIDKETCKNSGCQEKERELAIQKIIIDMLESWHTRSTSEEAQRKSPLMTLIEQTPQDAFISMMNDESQPMNPIISMSDEAQQQTAILSMMNDEPLQQNPILPALNEPPVTELSSSVEDESDEDESVTFITDYKQLYKDLKQNLKCVIKENTYFKEVLKSSQKGLLRIIHDRNFLLDQLLKYESVDVSSSDSDATVLSDDSVKVDAQPKKRKSSQGSTTSQGKTITSQGSTSSGMKPPATPRRNKKIPKKQQQQQQKRQQQKQQQKKQQQQQHKQVPQPQEPVTGPVLPLASHLTVPQQQLQPQQQLLQPPEQLSQSSQDMLDQLTPEEQLLLHMQQDKLMDLIKQIPQSQQMLQAAQPPSEQPQQLIQPHRPAVPQTQQQLMQPLQLQTQQQQQMLQSQQSSQVVQPQVLVDPQQMLHQPVQQIQLLQQQPLQVMAPSQQYINNPTPPVMLQMRQPQINQRQINQQQIRQHQIDQMELQQLQQHILFQPPTYVQQPATSNAYQFPISMMSQVPTELLATTSYTDIDVPGDDISMESQITKEELERHLQSRQTMPQVIPEGELPIEMFNNNSSNEPNDQLN